MDLIILAPNSGFEKTTGLLFEAKECTDINECEGGAACADDDNSVCVNLAGHHECHCKPETARNDSTGKCETTMAEEPRQMEEAQDIEATEEEKTKETSKDEL